MPLLAALGAGLGREPWRLLFVERREFITRIPDPAEIDHRIDAYMARAGYLEANKVDLARLQAIFHPLQEAETVVSAPANIDRGSVAGVTLQGTGAAPGRAAGRAHVRTAETAAVAVPPGAVLVIPVLHPYLAPALARLAAVVVEEGGLLQHATVLAQRVRHPCRGRPTGGDSSHRHRLLARSGRSIGSGDRGRRRRRGSHRYASALMARFDIFTG